MSEVDRRRCYATLTEIMKAAMRQYAATFPERADDVRHEDALAWSLGGLQSIFEALDEYHIEKKAPTEHTQSPSATP